MFSLLREEETVFLQSAEQAPKPGSRGREGALAQLSAALSTFSAKASKMHSNMPTPNGKAPYSSRKYNVQHMKRGSSLRRLSRSSFLSLSIAGKVKQSTSKTLHEVGSLQQAKAKLPSLAISCHRVPPVLSSPLMVIMQTRVGNAQVKFSLPEEKSESVWMRTRGAFTEIWQFTVSVWVDIKALLMVYEARTRPIAIRDSAVVAICTLHRQVANK